MIRFLNEPSDSAILFFSNNKAVFPIVVPYHQIFSLDEEASRYQKLTNFKYTGLSTTVESWNTLVRNGRDPIRMALDGFSNGDKYVFC
jgi:hypothetical protein